MSLECRQASCTFAVDMPAESHGQLMSQRIPVGRETVLDVSDAPGGLKRVSYLVMFDGALHREGLLPGAAGEGEVFVARGLVRNESCEMHLDTMHSLAPRAGQGARSLDAG